MVSQKTRYRCAADLENEVRCWANLSIRARTHASQCRLPPVVCELRDGERYVNVSECSLLLSKFIQH